MIKEIILGRGCFWCLEAVFRMAKGVVNVIPGYSGGHVENPTYNLVCSGRSGHAEVVQVQYDEQIISLNDLLRIFFELHDPTTPDRQGNDIGSQYRSVILYYDDYQKQISLQIMEEVQSKISLPIITELQPLKRFYAAEKNHHEYYQRNSSQPYCRGVITPKLKKLLQSHPELLN